MTAPVGDDPTWLDDLERAHERCRAGGIDGFTAMLDLTVAVPTLIAALRKRDARIRAGLALADQCESTGRLVLDHPAPSNKDAAIARTLIEAAEAITAALTPESVQS